MNTKTSIYYYEKKGLALSIVLMIILALMNMFISVPPQWLPLTNAWLIALLCIATVVIAFVITMYKRVTVLKKHLKDNLIQH